MANKGGCLGCKFFNIEPGYCYSEYTQEDFSATCAKIVFESLNGKNGDVWYKVVCVEGSTCDKYEQADHVK